MRHKVKPFDLIEEKNAPFSRTTMWRLRNRKDDPLRCFKVGRRIYYSRRHIDEFLRKSERRTIEEQQAEPSQFNCADSDKEGDSK